MNKQKIVILSQLFYEICNVIRVNAFNISIQTESIMRFCKITYVKYRTMGLDLRHSHYFLHTFSSFTPKQYIFMYFIAPL